MILKKLYLKWKLKRLLNLNKINPYKTNRKLCMALLNELDVSKFNNYKPDIGLAIFVNVAFINIDIFNKKLKELNLIIQSNNNVPYTWDSNFSVAISLDRFLISEDGYYLDINKILTDFKSTALKLCKLMEESDTVQYGVMEHNARMTTRLFNNLIGLLIILVELSIELN